MGIPIIGFDRTSFNTPDYDTNETYISQIKFSSKENMNMFMIGVEKQF